MGFGKVSWGNMKSGKVYIHQTYHEFFWGPFNTITEAKCFIEQQKEKDEYWDYDGYAFVKGNPYAKCLDELYFFKAK